MTQSALFPLPEMLPDHGALDAPPSWQFSSLRMGHYRLIYADPAWLFENYSAAGQEKNPLAHYACMSLEDMKALPVGALAAPDCALVMWCIWSMVGEALDLMRSWGFDLKTGGAWAKQSSTGSKWAFGTGYIYRAASEFWLLGTRGAPRLKSRSVRNLIVDEGGWPDAAGADLALLSGGLTAPVREHSRKPDQMITDLEALFDGPRCELFARTQRPGWDCWGNETGKF